MRRASSTMRLVAGVAVLTTFTVFACSGDDDGESSGTTTTTEAGSEGPTTSSGNGESTATTDDQGTPTSNGSEEPCTETDDWNTEPEELQAMSTDPIYLMDAGRHDAPQCFDQLTFRLNGAADVGYYVGYADGSDVRVEGDQLLPTAGDAALVVDISAPVQGGPFDQTGHQPGVIFADAFGQTLYSTSNPSGLNVINEVRFAGEIEVAPRSVSSFAVGVDRQRPFAVRSLVNEDSSRVIVIRIAH
jgi:hypothetical protein